MDTMLQKTNLICIYLIKETNSRLVHLCLNEENELLVSFSTKTYFSEDISCDLTTNCTPYLCHYQHDLNTDTITIKNCARIFKQNYDQNLILSKWLNVLGELLFHSKQQKLDKLYEILMFINTNNDQLQNVFILCKIILLIIHKNLNINIQHKYFKLEQVILINNYDIIYKDLSINKMKKILMQYYDLLEQYGLELYSLQKI